MYPSPQLSKTDLRLIDQTIAGRYKVLDLIAKGGMGRVYKAEQLPLGRIVALKLLRPSLRSKESLEERQARFLREASTYAKLQHPNIISIFDYGEIDEGADEPTFFMVMEYLEGHTLAQEIQTNGRLDVSRACRIGWEIARALREAHAQGVIHRDLKPSNIMLTDTNEGEQVKILDFGVAKLLETEDQNLTLADVVLGSPRYMAPEQILNNQVDEQTDIYSLGIVMYECIAGLPPFNGAGMTQTMMAHVHDPIPKVREFSGVEIPPKVEQLLVNCLQKSPEARIQSVGELMEAMRALDWLIQFSAQSTDSSMQLPELAVTTNMREQMLWEAEPRRKRAIWLAILLLLFLGAGVWWFTRVGEPTGELAGVEEGASDVGAADVGSAAPAAAPAPVAAEPPPAAAVVEEAAPAAEPEAPTVVEAPAPAPKPKPKPRAQPKPDPEDEDLMMVR